MSNSSPATWQPLVSIIVGNYNYAGYVADAIESALAQTYPRVEVIVVDDGSSDPSRDVIERYSGRVRLKFKPNGGQGSVYNAGLRMARGELVLFLDSDDVLKPEAVAKAVGAFAVSDAVKVQYYLEQVDAELNPLGARHPGYPFPHVDPREEIAIYGYYVSPTASGNVYRKSFLDRIMPIEDEELFRRSADSYPSGLAGLTGKVATLDEVLGLYRVHGANGSDAGDVRTLPHLHHIFMRDLKRERMLHELGDRLGFRFAPERARFIPSHTKLRLLSYRLAPEQHPIASDTRLGLLWSGVLAALRFPHLKPSKRLVAIAGFVALAVMPPAFLQRQLSAVISPRHRSSSLRWLAG